MVHSKLETMEQMVEEYKVFCEDLLSDGHEGDPASFVLVMSEWEIECSGVYRLTDIELVRNFLYTFRWTTEQVEYMVEEITKYDDKGVM